jgi:hypothetical protein
MIGLLETDPSLKDAEPFLADDARTPFLIPWNQRRSALISFGKPFEGLPFPYL